MQVLLVNDDRIFILNSTTNYVAQASDLRSGVVFRFGETYRPGIYIVQVWNGKEMKSVKLVKK